MEEPLTRRSALGLAIGGLTLFGVTSCQRSSGPSGQQGETPTSALPSVVQATTNPATTPPLSGATTDSTPTVTNTPSTAYVPPARGTWEMVDPADAGWDSAKLDAAFEFAFAHNTHAMVVVAGGRLMRERYTTDASYSRDIASAQKSQTSLLIGRAAQEGLLSIDAPVSTYIGANWIPAGNETSITVRHLLTMTSGLDETLRKVAEPGATWLYNTSAYQQLLPLLETITGKSLDDVAHQWLWDPIGASSSRFGDRGRTVPGASQGLTTTARDLARVGVLVQRDGQWGHDLVYPAADYLTHALTSSTSLNPSYGYLWWLNGQSGYMLPGPDPALRPGHLVPAAPADMVAALGKDDQKLYVSTTLDVVVTRLGTGAGDARDALSSFDNDLWTKIAAARI